MVEVAVEAYSVCACSDPLSKSVEKEIDIMKCPFLRRVAIFLFGDYFFETRTKQLTETVRGKSSKSAQQIVRFEPWVNFWWADSDRSKQA